MAHLVISCLFTHVPFFCSFFQSSHLLMPISFFIILNPSFYACSFLHNSLHTSICELHYAIPFLSHRILIMHMLIAPLFMLNTAFFLSASYLPQPALSTLPFNAPIFKSHYTPPCLYHYAHLFMHLIAPLPMHIFLCISVCTSHYGLIKHVHVIIPL